MPHRQRSFPFSVSEAQGAFHEEDNDAFRKRYVSLLIEIFRKDCTALTDTGLLIRLDVVSTDTSWKDVVCL